MKVLITGATGFAGQAICRILEEAGLDIIRVGGPHHPAGNILGKNRENQISEFPDFSVDLTDADAVTSLSRYEDVTCLIHCAGLAHQAGETRSERFFEINAKGTERIAAQAVRMKVNHLILISTVAVYGENRSFEDLRPEEEQENAICRPVGPYGRSKLAAEKMATEICRENNIRLTILRPSTILGEDDPGNFMRLIKAVEKRRFIWLGNGRNKKSFIYKDDLGRACLEIIRKSVQPLEIFNVTAEAVSIRKIMLSLKNILGRPVPRIPFPSWFILNFFGTVQRREPKKDVGYSQIRKRADRLKKYSETLEKWFAEENYSGEKLKKSYDYIPSISVEEALERECRVYLERKC